MSVGRDKHAWAAGPCVEVAGGTKSVGRWLEFALWIWALALGVALGALWKYKLTPAAASAVAPTWPAASALHRDAQRPTLVLFAHPRCPCTRASLAELRAVLSPFADQVSVEVVFFHAGGSPASFSHTDTWSSAQSIPGVAVVADPDGREAARFGATTSGEVALYDSSGRLRFEGGITPARGHQGDSPGKRRLSELLSELTHEASAREAAEHAAAVSAVYGCPLEDRR